MIYATAQDLIDDYGSAAVAQLADRQVPFLGAIDDAALAVIDAALADASAEIDGYVLPRWPDGFEVPPRLLNAACRRLAWLILHRDRPTEDARDAAADARRTLRDVADGRVTLPGARNAAPRAVSPGATPVPLDGVFSLDKMESF